MSTVSRQIRVLIADDHPLFRAGVVAVLGRQSDMVVVGQATTGTEAIDLARTEVPDVVLMDLQMPAMDGLTAMRAIHREFPDMRVLVVTTYGGDVQTARALRYGARDYLLKGMLRTDLVDKIRAVMRPAGTGGGVVPDAEPQEIERFSTTNIEWLTRALAGKSRATADVGARALAIHAAIEGAQLIARGFNDITLYDRTIKAYRAAGLIP